MHAEKSLNRDICGFVRHLRCQFSGLRHRGHVYWPIANTIYSIKRPVGGFSRFRDVFDWLTLLVYVAYRNYAALTRAFADILLISFDIYNIGKVHRWFLRMSDHLRGSDLRWV